MKISDLDQSKVSVISNPQASSTLKLSDLDASKLKVVSAVPAQNQSILGAGLSAGVEAASNIPSSLYNFGKGIVNTIAHPLDTLSGIGNVFLGGVSKAIPGTQKEEGSFNALTTALKNRYGSLENLQKTATEDPFGFGADVFSILDSGATLLGRGEEFGKLVSNTSKLATAPITKAADTVGSGINKTAKFAASQTTGLNPETIQSIIENPSQFSRASQAAIDRPALGQEVKSTLNARLKSLKDTGAGYDIIRHVQAHPELGINVVKIPQGTIESVLSKYGVKLGIDESGGIKVLTSPESRPLSTGDRAAIEDFYNNYGKEKSLSFNSFLNTREALSNLAKYDQSKTSISTGISRELRQAYDTLGKDQIPGLAELDAKYSPERQLLNQAKKDFFDAQGNLKDSALSKIANATGAGKDQLLDRLEQLSPGVTQKIKVLKAVEDIERASGLKVGTYFRSGVAGAAALTGNVPAIVGAILTSPKVAVPLIRGYGLTKPQISEVLRALRSAGSAVNNFNIPTAITDVASKEKI